MGVDVKIQSQDTLASLHGVSVLNRVVGADVDRRLRVKVVQGVTLGVHRTPCVVAL